MNGLFGSNLSVDTSEVSRASRRTDPYLGMTPGGRSVETRTQASDRHASLSATHCNHSRPIFPAFNHLPRSDDRLLGGLTISGPAVPFIGVSVLGRLFGNAISVASLVMNLIQIPAAFLPLSSGTAQENKAAFAPRASHHGLRQPVVWAAA